MNFKRLTLGFLAALAAGGGLRAQGWDVSVVPSGSRGYLYAGVPALSIDSYQPSGDPDQPAGTLIGSFSRPWHGDPLLEGLTDGNAQVQIVFQTLGNAPLTTIQPTGLTQWELKGERGVGLTEKVVFTGLTLGVFPS